MATQTAIQTSTRAGRARPSPVVYKKTTLKGDYMKCPANAIVVGTVGPNKGKLLLACGILNMIVVLDPDTGKIIREYGKQYDIQGALDDVREGPDGTLYFTHLGAASIGYIRPDDTYGQIPIKPSGNSLCITRDGKWLYYGLCILDDELWRVELEDGLPKKGAKHELVEQNPGWANSMVEGADGYIYSPSNMYGEIRRINPETKEITVIATNTEFPSSCKVNDATGVIYVSEFHLGYISRIDPRIKDPRKNKRVLSVAAPSTDNVAVMSGPTPRLFGTTFIEDWIYEVYENGDPIRTIVRGGIPPFQIQVIKGANGGDRIFITDLGRVREYFPIENRYSTIAHGNFWQYAQDKAFDKGFQRYDKDRINWTASFEDRLTIPFHKTLQPTSEGHLIVAGGMFENFGNRIAVLNIDTGEALRIVKDLDHVQDAIMVGKDIYMMEGTAKEFPIAARITRITPDDKRETVFTGKDFVAFARSDDAAFAADVGADTIYQVVKDGKWIAQPIEVVSGLNGPQGMTIGNDGNLLVMEKNEGLGRMLKVDLKTKEITVLADALGVDPKLDKRNWQVATPHAAVAQTSDGTIYFTEPGVTEFSMLRAQ